MVLHGNKFKALLAIFIAMVMMIGMHSAVAQDVVHGISGVVKSVDKGTKTFVVKTADGTEHTFKWTDKTVVKGTKDTGKGIAKGTEDTSKEVAKGTEETGKDVDKGSVDTYMGAKKGAKVTVKYTEKAGEKTAVGVKDAGKATGKALE